MRHFSSLSLFLALAAPTVAADPPAPATPLARAKAAGDAYQVTEARRLYAEAVAEARRTGGVPLAAALREQGQYLGTLRLLREAEAALTEAGQVLAKATEAGQADPARAERAAVARVRSEWLEAAGMSSQAATWTGEEYRLRKEHATAAPADAARREAWARSGDRYANALIRVGKETPAEAVLAECLAAVDRPDDPARFSVVGLLTNTRALLLKDTGRWDEADKAYSAALVALRAALDRDPASADARHAVVSVIRNRGYIRQMVERGDEALRDLEEASALERALPAADPADRKRLFQDVQRATHLASAQLPAAGTARGATTLAEYRKRAADHPDVPGLQLELLMAVSLEALKPVEGGQKAAAGDAVKECLDLAAGLRDRYPDVPAYRSSAAAFRVALALAYQQSGRFAEAAPLLASGVADLDKLADERADDPTFLCRAAGLRTQVANAYAQSGRTAEAIAMLRTTLPQYRRLAEKFPDALQFAKTDAQSAQTVAHMLFAEGRFAEAEPALRDNVPAWEALVHKHPDIPFYRDQLGRTYELLAYALAEQPGKLAEGRGAAARGLALRAAVAKDFPTERRYRDRLAQSHVLAGNLLVRAEDPAGAAVAYGRAVEVMEGLLRTDPKDGAARHDLAEILKKRGSAHNAAGNFAEFTKDYDRAQELARGSGR